MTDLITKPLDIIESKADRNILSEVGNFQKDFMQPISDIQVNKLVLNSIDYPTDYAKLKQIKSELIVRYHSITESYYSIKKKELELELLMEEIENEMHPIKKQLKTLDSEKATLGLMAEQSKLDVILSELRIYYKYYQKYITQFKNLTETQKVKEEEKLWELKALNNPIVFEERYGDYLKDILGDVMYQAYSERRKSAVGNFPRELIP